LLPELLLTGCVGVRTFPTIEPVSFKPSLISPNQPVLVDSPTPTFIWRQYNPSDKADFAIWSIDGGAHARYRERDAVVGSRVKLGRTLKPDGDYCWSVRISGSRMWPV
jgi:hypothetical protein